MKKALVALSLILVSFSHSNKSDAKNFIQAKLESYSSKFHGNKEIESPNHSVPAHKIRVDYISNGVEFKIVGATGSLHSIKSIIDDGHGKFDDHSIDMLLKKLNQTGLFNDIKIERLNGKVYIKVLEHLIVRRTNISGGKELTNKNLKKSLVFKENSPLNRHKLDDLKKKIIASYEDKGFMGVKIVEEIKPVAGCKIDLKLKIEKKSKPIITQVKFIGNCSFSRKELLKIIYFGESRGFLLNILTGKSKFGPEVNEVNSKILENFYHDHGFIDFKIINTQSEYDKKFNSIKVTYELFEGKKFEVVSIDTSEIQVQNEILRRQLCDLLILGSGKIYKRSEFDSRFEKAKDFINKQYDTLELSVEFKKINDRQLIAYYKTTVINPILVENIIITGNTKTKDGVIRDKMKFHEGDVLNSSKIKESHRSIMNLNFFEKVDVNYKINERKNVDLFLNILEKKTGTIDVSGGYSSINKAFARIHYGETNILGTGNVFDLSAEKSKKNFLFSLGFYKNNFLDTNLSAGVSVFFDKEKDTLWRRDHDFDPKNLGPIKDHKNKSFIYNTTNKGVAFSTRIPLDDNLSIALRYQLKSTTVSDVENGSPGYIKEQEGTKISSSIKYKLDFDKRNSASYPTEGHQLLLEQELAGLFAQKYFLSSELKFQFYKTLNGLFGSDKTNEEATVLQLQNSAGYTFGYNNYKLMITDRFFLRDVRGFAPLHGITPHNTSGDPLGGDIYFSGNVQVEFPLGILKELNLKSHFFIDYGMLFNKKKLQSELEDGNDRKLRSSVGVGIIVTIPKLFPLYVDLAFPMSYNEGDFLKKISFNVGRKF